MLEKTFASMTISSNTLREEISEWLEDNRLTIENLFEISERLNCTNFDDIEGHFRGVWPYESEFLLQCESELYPSCEDVPDSIYSSEVANHYIPICLNMYQTAIFSRDACFDNR